MQEPGMSPKPIILVVDDDQTILTLMRNVLKEFGFEALVAGTGTAAIEAARQRRPDLVLLDKNMPGMTGSEIIKALRRERDLAHVPVVILSGEPLAPAEIAGMGAAGAIMKPFDVLTLVDQIRAYAGVAR
jgi:two-component system chemotaxis response regulator CheY